MGSALAHYLGMVNIMDCSSDIIYAALSGFFGGALLTMIINMIMNDRKK